MIFLFLVPVSIAMGLVGFAAFCWALRNDQFEDLDGAAWRVVLQHQEQCRLGQDPGEPPCTVHGGRGTGNREPPV